MQVAEERSRTRRIDKLSLKVEEQNLGARELYERLGYVVSSRGFDEWAERNSQGDLLRYVRISTWILDKPLH